MLKKILLLIAAITVAKAASAQVTVAANGVANLVEDSSGNPLALGDLVRIGYFPGSALTTLETSNSFATLNSLFTPIGEGNSGGGTLNESGNSGNVLDINNYGGTQGAFLGNFSNVNLSYLPAGSLLYLWVFNSSSTSTATQWGIFDDPSQSSWTFPTSSLGSSSLSLSLPGVNPIRGGTSGQNFQLANISAVPEPSSYGAMAGAIAIGAMVLRRRR